MITIDGKGSGTGDVQVNGHPLDPKPSQRVFNHSPDGFSWGYGGSGPAQLALAILLDAGVPEDEAVALHHRFKAQFLAPLPQADFHCEIDLDAWLADTRSTLATSSPPAEGEHRMPVQEGPPTREES